MLLFFNGSVTADIFTYLPALSPHDSLPTSRSRGRKTRAAGRSGSRQRGAQRGPCLLSRTSVEKRRHSCPSQRTWHKCGGRLPLRSGWRGARSEEHTSELQSLMRNSYAVFCLKKKKKQQTHTSKHTNTSQNMYIHNNTKH